MFSYKSLAMNDQIGDFIQSKSRNLTVSGNCVKCGNTIHMCECVYFKETKAKN